MRRAPSAATLAAMQLNETQRLILDASIEHSVIRGTLTAPSGDGRGFYGWLELNTALEAMLDSGTQRRDAGHTAVKATPNARDTVTSIKDHR